MSRRLREFLQPPFSLLLWLVVPVALVTVLAGAANGYISNSLLSSEMDSLARHRGQAVLGGIAGRLEEQRLDKEGLVRLMVSDWRLGEAMADRNEPVLRQYLYPLRMKSGVGEIVVYDAWGQELAELGHRAEGLERDLALEGALSGRMTSAVQVGNRGLLVSAAGPVYGLNGQLVGALEVRTPYGGGLSNAIGQTEGVEIAVIRDGRLVGGSVGDSRLAQVLDGPNGPNGLEGPSGIEGPNGLEGIEASQATLKLDELYQAVSGLGYFSVASPLSENAWLVAFVPTGDISAALSHLELALQLVTVGMLVALVLVVARVARDVTRSVKGIAQITDEMGDGRYDAIVPASQIREFNTLGMGINRLGEQIRLQMARLRHQAFYDALTGLPNRALFADRLERALSHLSRRRTGVALLFLDLDEFKKVNDNLGHQVGDILLVAVANRLQALLRKEDTLARLGGDEFTILLEEVRGLEEAARVAERILEMLQAPFMVLGREVYITASIGVAVNKSASTAADDLLRCADLALYSAKENGKARCEVFDESLDDWAADRYELENDLRYAVERGELELLYQPIVRTEDSSIREVEALVRWNHPRRGLVMPDTFIPIAEDTRLIIQIGEWVLGEACRQTKSWHERGSSPYPLTVAVNISGRQFQQAGLAGCVARILRETGLPAEYLKLEITESVLMENGASTLAILKELKAIGVKLAIDDFGTGYSSLAYLKGFPIDCLKIDRSFIQRLVEQPEDAAIVRAILEMARTLGLGVTSEGVENLEQIEHLRAMRCDKLQGYYFARPLPAPALEAILADPSTRLGRTGASIVSASSCAA